MTRIFLSHPSITVDYLLFTPQELERRMEERQKQLIEEK